VDFCANLAMHDERKVYWAEYEYLYYDGYQTHSYDDALAKLQYVLDYIGISSSNTSVEKIAGVLKFMNKYLHYEPDMIDKFFAPVETLAYRSGDCEDYSILAAALFELVGVDAAVAFFDDADLNGHAMTLVHLDSLGQYSYVYSPDLTSLGLSAGTWITIEPQSVITEQSGSWFAQWYLEVAAET
jgi:transglutaminase-like putative cysteine protease